MRTHTVARFVGLSLLLASVAGCQIGSVENLDLPGAVGTGSNAIVIKAELPDVGTLTKNAQVKVNDLVVGTVTDLTVKNWHAEATLSLRPDTQLPRDLRVSVGVNSLLGSSYVELAPATESALGQASSTDLTSGTTIPLERGHAYPSTEQVLSSASLVLNGGGLEQLETITREANRALGGDGQAFADLLPRLESFVTALNEQQGDIRTTIRALDAAAGNYADNRKTITDALDQLGPALDALDEERPELTEALQSLAKLRRTAVPLVDNVQPALVADLENLQPTLKALAKAGPDLVRALGFLVTFPFSPDAVTRACHTDYCNLFLTLDLTNQSILDGFLTEDGQLGIPGIGPLAALTKTAVSNPDRMTAKTPVETSDEAGVPNGLNGVLEGLLGTGKSDNSGKEKPKSGGLLGGLLNALGVKS